MADDYTAADFWSKLYQGQYTDPNYPRHGSDHDLRKHEEDAEENDGAAEAFEKLRQNLLTQLEAPQFSNKLKAQIRSSIVLQLTPHEVLTAKPPFQKPDPVGGILLCAASTD